MKSVALVIRFVHQAEIPSLHADLVDALDMIKEHEKWPGYNPDQPPRLYVKDSATHSWVLYDNPWQPEF